MKLYQFEWARVMCCEVYVVVRLLWGHVVCLFVVQAADVAERVRGSRVLLIGAGGIGACACNFREFRRGGSWDVSWGRLPCWVS